MDWEEVYRQASPMIEEGRISDLSYAVFFSVPIVIFYLWGIYSYFHQKISFLNLALITLPAVIWPILCFSPYFSSRKDPSVVSGKLIRKWKSSNHGQLMLEVDVKSVRVLKNYGKETEEIISSSRMNFKGEQVFDKVQESEDIMFVLNGKSEAILRIPN